MAAQSVICVADGLSRSFTSQRLKNGRRMSPLLEWKEAKNTSTRATLREAHIDISSPVEYYRAFDSRKAPIDSKRLQKTPKCSKLL